MKKISFLLILAIITLSACNKQDQNINPQADIQTLEKSSPIDVSISDTISVDSDLCTEFGVNGFNILPGTYYLTFDTTYPYGIVTFDIEAPSGLKEEPSHGIGIQIKVAKRYARKCPTDYCACGIGFRCGFVTWDGPASRTTEEAERYLDCTVFFNTTEITVRMDEEIPIGDTGWELE